MYNKIQFQVNSYPRFQEGDNIIAMKKFLSKYYLLIITSGLILYGLGQEFGLVHSISTDQLFLGILTLMVGEMFRIENHLGKLEAKSKGKKK